MLLSVSPDLSLGFGTPISNRSLPSAPILNPSLEKLILERFRYGGNQLSNIGGWQSGPDLHSWNDHSIAQLKDEMDKGIQAISAMPALVGGRPYQKRVAYRMVAWANVNQNGHYNMGHTHPGCDWSVVYYVSIGNPAPNHPLNGQLELRDPRAAAAYSLTPGSNAGQSLLIRPRPGMMLIFPAWIDHCVHPYFGEGSRISIAANVTLHRE